MFVRFIIIHCIYISLLLIVLSAHTKKQDEDKAVTNTIINPTQNACRFIRVYDYDIIPIFKLYRIEQQKMPHHNTYTYVTFQCECIITFSNLPTI